MNNYLSFFFGLTPALVWLWFWLKEDKKHPEPKKYIFITFVAGMLTAIAVIPFETGILKNTVHYSLFSFALLAFTEEFSKYIFARFSILNRKVVDEPIDTVIYMITIALGFAAMENILYLWNAFDPENIRNGIMMTNMRFVGASVLHTAASAIIGASMSFSFFKSKLVKKIYLYTGILLAVALHTYFNFFIINSESNNIYKIFVFIWLVILALLLIFEKIKNIKKLKNNK